MNNIFFSDWKVNSILAFGASSRAQTGFGFIRDCLDPLYGLRSRFITVPYCRQLRILISHNFELILDAAVYLGLGENSEASLINETKVGHRLDNLWNKIHIENKELLGIKDIKRYEQNKFISYYEINLLDKKIIEVDDLISIRYDNNDFRGRKNTHLRKADKGDFDDIADICYKISTKLMQHIENNNSKNKWKI